MKVMKFGGATIGKPQRMKHVAQLISKDEQPKIVVLSALSRTTTMLVEISHCLQHNDRSRAARKIEKLKVYYIDFAQSLLQSETIKQQVINVIEEDFQFFKTILKISFSEALKNDILAQGELTGSKLFSACLDDSGIQHELIPALDFVQLDAYGEPLVGNIKVKLTQLLNKHKDKTIFITQGSLCRNSKGEVDNLKRGGSDYTASLIAGAIGAEACEIWTDIDLLKNNNGTVTNNASPVEQLSFDEAAELAYFGEKVLHPHTLWPAKRFNIPVKLRNVLEPGEKHTLILNEASGKGVKAIAAREGITAIKIGSSRMLMSYGFIKKVFEVFEKHETSIDMIATSEVSVSLTIDNSKHLEKILDELEQFGTTEIDENQCLVVIIGKDIVHDTGVMMKVFESVSSFPVRMLSYGGSRDNISLVISAGKKDEALEKLYKSLFGY